MRPAITDRQWRLLVLITEESSEVIKEKCKIERSGPDFVPYADEGRTATNLDNLKTELIDLYVVLGELIDDEEFISIGEFAELRIAKLKKLARFEPETFKDI